MCSSGSHRSRSGGLGIGLLLCWHGLAGQRRSGHTGRGLCGRMRWPWWRRLWLSQRFRRLHSRRNRGYWQRLGGTRGCPGRRFLQKAKVAVGQVPQEGHGFVVEGLEVILVLVQKSDQEGLGARRGHDAGGCRSWDIKCYSCGTDSHSMHT